MSINAIAYIMGAYEHPTRKAPDKTIAQLHAECAAGALADAGLSMADVDGYFCAGDAPGMGPISMIDYMGLNVRHIDSTELGGSSYMAHISHAAQAIAMRKCSVALITLAGKPRTSPPNGQEPQRPNIAIKCPMGLVLLTHTACVLPGICMNLAPQPNNWRGLKWRHRTMLNIIRMQCCKNR